MPERLLPQNKEERKKEMESKIDFKIKQIIEIRDLSTHCADLSLEDIKSKFEEKFEYIIEEFSEETRAKFNQLQKLDLEFNKNRAKQLDIEDYMKDSEKLSPDKQKKWEELGDKQYGIMQEISGISQNSDVLFLKKVRDFFDNLIKKRKQVLEWQKRYNQDRSANKYKFFKKFTSSFSFTERLKILLLYQIISIDFIGYNVDIILRPDIFANYFGPNLQGRHFTGTAINILKYTYDSQTLNEFINHEHNHNISESFVENYLYAKDFINLTKRRLQRFDRLIQINAPQSIIDYEKKCIERSIQNYYLENEGELIADIDTIPTKTIFTYKSNMTKFVDLMEDFIAKEVKDDFGIKQSMKDALEKMKNRFAQHLETIKDILGIAIKENIVNETKAALILFGFGRLEKVSIYQEYICDKKTF